MPKKRSWKEVNEIKKREAALDRKNAFGTPDPTPYEAIERIRNRQQREAPGRFFVEAVTQ